MATTRATTTLNIPAERKKAAIERDPVPKVRAQLIADGVATEEDLARIDKQWLEKIEASIRYARQPVP
ncbi:MAG TPA: hypothetical protein VGL34_25800 [Steroidobacteraceae bacterium]|jgi:pyruvate dehydrogenase E1 component alpha subunit